MINAKVVHERMMAEDPEYRREYEALEEEFNVIETLLKARGEAGMTQAQVAEAMGVSQPAVARIESGRNLSMNTLRRYAHALGRKVRVELV